LKLISIQYFKLAFKLQRHSSVNDTCDLPLKNFKHKADAGNRRRRDVNVKLLTW
jgi:hypothetical protein